MQKRIQKRNTNEGQVGPTSTAKKKPAYRVIHGTGERTPAEQRPPKIRVVNDREGERLTATELKQRFARNFDMLLSLVGLNRKEAAQEIGLAHKFVLRLVSAGISRTDQRNLENLRRIASYFALPGVDCLWNANLLRQLLATEGSSDFVERFRPRLLAERERRLAEERALGHDEQALLSRALGFGDAPLPLTGPYADKVRAILASSQAQQFRRLIDDYFQLATRLA